MVRAVFDSNIVIDFLNGQPEAIAAFGAYHPPVLSIISWIEVMAGSTATSQDDTRKFLGNFDIIALNQEIAEEAMDIRRTYRLKLPDAVIWASARVEGLIFVTRDVKGFGDKGPKIHIPYQLG
jgi:predicted nucleic acid-binding protein